MSDIRSKFSRLGFGLMRLPKTSGEEIDIPQLCDMVDAYMGSGFNYFDTAYMYHNGKSETAIKQALVDRYPRDAYVLATKLPQWFMQAPEDADRILAEQLERTGAGHFDFYLLHSIEDGANYEGYTSKGCFEWGQRQKAEGHIGHFGFSFHGSPALLDEVLTKHPEMEFAQIQLNYADWDNPLLQAGKLYEILRRHDMPTIVMEPVKGGALANIDPAIAAPMKKARPQDSIASWALRFVGSLEGVDCVLSGMSTIAQMQDNLAIFKDFEPLSEAEKGIIAEVNAAMQGMPTVPCTDCRYCIEGDGCPQNIQIPEVFKALNALRMFEKDNRPHFFYESLVENGGRAGDCIQCGQCEAVCPQHLKIIALMEEASGKLDKTAE